MKGRVLRLPGGSRREISIFGETDFRGPSLVPLQAAGNALAVGLMLSTARGGESSIRKEGVPSIRLLAPGQSLGQVPLQTAGTALAVGFIWVLFIPFLAGAQQPASAVGPDSICIIQDPPGNRQADIRKFPSDITYFRTDKPSTAPVRSSGASSWAVRNPGRDSWTGMDKARHFTASFIITGASAYWMKHEENRNAHASLAAGMGFAFSLGIAKEIGDMRKPGNFFSWKDLAADAAGVLAGSLLVAWW
jgi:putative lipoprotein